MADFTRIEWADHTFNPWEGCQKVGPGCEHCYAETRNARFGGGIAPNWGPHAQRRRTSPANWRKPHAWQRAAPAFFAAHGRRQRIFCASLADVFDKAAPEGVRDELANTIRATPDLDWLLLTKRIGNAARMLREMFPEGVPANVKLGITVVNQAEADRDNEVAVNTVCDLGMQTFFLSIEPMLGPITFIHDHLSHISQVIAGGESGPNARPAHPDWFRSLRDECAAAGVPFFFKQWGEWTAASDTYQATHWFGPKGLRPRGGGDWTVGDEAIARVGKAKAGRTLDGVEHNGLPA
ncbi:MAG: hypothetical protein RL490_116 [Pseudomonadota bacterium]